MELALFLIHREVARREKDIEYLYRPTSTTYMGCKCAETASCRVWNNTSLCRRFIREYCAYIAHCDRQPRYVLDALTRTVTTNLLVSRYDVV